MSNFHWFYGSPLGPIVVIYFAPTIICLLRLKLLRLIPVFLLNTAFGWTGIGWFSSLIMATTG